MKSLARFVATGLCGVVMAFAQTSGTIQGTVTDDTGAVIPGALIAVRNTDTGIENAVSTNEVGFYTVPGLNQGVYSVTCSSDGFSSQEFLDVRLEVQQTMRIDCAMSVGSITETVEVNAAAILIQSEKTEVGQVIDSKRILEMPLNGRNYLELAKFTVGVLPSREMGKGTRHDGVMGGEGGILAMGMHAARPTCCWMERTIPRAIRAVPWDSRRRPPSRPSTPSASSRWLPTTRRRSTVTAMGPRCW